YPDREECHRIRVPDRSRGGPRLSADGVDRRAHLLLRRGLLCGLLRLLSGITGDRHGRSARARPDLFLCAAADLREHPDASHDPDGGRRLGKAKAVPLLSRCCKTRRPGGPRPASGRLGRSGAYWLGGLLVYGPLKNTLGLSRVRVAYT